MIEINQNNIVKIFHADKQYVKAYKNNSIVYKLKEDSGDLKPYLYVNQANHGWFNFDYFWDNNYRMEIDCRLTSCQDADTGFMGKSFLLTSPLELCMWGDGFYFDFHKPNSTTSPTVANSDYNKRNSCNPSIAAYADKRPLRFILRTNPYQYVEVYDIEA